MRRRAGRLGWVLVGLAFGCSAPRSTASGDPEAPARAAKKGRYPPAGAKLRLRRCERFAPTTNDAPDLGRAPRAKVSFALVDDNDPALVRGLHAYRDGTSFHLVFSLGSFGYEGDQEPRPMGELVYCRDGKDTTIVGPFCENHSDSLIMEATHTPRLVITVHNAPSDLTRAHLHLADFCGPETRARRKWQGHAESFGPVDSAGRRTLERAQERPVSNDPPVP